MSNLADHASLLKRKEVLYKALVRVVEKFNLSQKELSSITGMSESTVSRLHAHKRTIDPHSKEGELIILLIRLYRSLDTILGGNELQCQKWLRSYNSYLNGIPLDVIESVQGLVETVNYLDAMRGKI